MYTFKLNIGSLATPVKGGGYVTVSPLVNGNGLKKETDDKYFGIIRKNLKKKLDFKQTEYRALKTLSDDQVQTVEMKIYYNGLERWYGYLVLSGDWDEDEQTCSLETQVIDQYSKLEKNLDVQTNVVGSNNNTVTLQYTAFVFDLVLPCFQGSRGEAEFYYDPNGLVSDDPLESHPDWGYYAENGEIDCGGGLKQYKYRTAILYFEADGFVQSQINPSQWLQASLVDVPVLLEIQRVSELYDVLETCINLADGDIIISKSTYSNYINNSTNLIDNLHIMDKSDAKRNEATTGASFEMITLKELLELYLEWFDLSYTLDEDKNFRFVRREDLTEVDYEANPQNDLTTYKDINFTINQKKYSSNLSERPCKEIITFEQCNQGFFDKAELSYDSFTDNIKEKNFAKFNNNIDYLRNDPGDVADSGFCVLSCNSGGVVRSQEALNGSKLTNGGMSAHLLFYNHLLDNKHFYEGDLDGYPMNLTKSKDREIVYSNIPYYDIDVIDFSYYVKTELGLAEPKELEIDFEFGFAKLKLDI